MKIEFDSLSGRTASYKDETAADLNEALKKRILELNQVLPAGYSLVLRPFKRQANLFESCLRIIPQPEEGDLEYLAIVQGVAGTISIYVKYRKKELASSVALNKKPTKELLSKLVHQFYLV